MADSSKSSEPSSPTSPDRHLLRQESQQAAETTSWNGVGGHLPGMPGADKGSTMGPQVYYNGGSRRSTGDTVVSVTDSNDTLTSVDYDRKGHFRQPRKRDCSLFCKCVIVCMFFVCLCLGGFISWALLTKSGQSVFSQNSGKSSATFCTPCRRLVLGSAPEDDYSKIFTKQTVTDGEETYDLCCIEDGNSEQLDAYIKAKAEQQIRQDDINGVPLMRTIARRISGSPNGPKPMAQLFAHGMRVKNGTIDYNELQPIKEYTHELEKTYKHDVEYDKLRGRVLITFPGYYDIVSHVSFVKVSADDEDESTVFAHEILRESRRYGGSDREIKTDVLAKDVQEKQCSGRRAHSRSDISCHTSTLFTSFKLNQHDEIFVQVTRKDLLELDGDTTFLGIRKVG